MATLIPTSETQSEIEKLIAENKSLQKRIDMTTDRFGKSLLKRNLKAQHGELCRLLNRIRD